jgi:hypothetical protein
LPKGVSLTYASLPQLKLAMTNFKLNNQSQFLFYATDHGGTVIPIKAGASKLDHNTSDTETYSLDTTTVTGIDDDSDAGAADNVGTGLSFNAYAPYVEIDYDSLDADNTAAVYAGSDLLGYLPSADTSIDFNIPYNDVGLSDDIMVVNNGADPFNLDAESFYGGDEAGDLAASEVPEPTSFGLMLLPAGLLIIRCGRRLSGSR